MPNAATDRLRAVQNADGGWGPYAGGESRTEPTALATLGLALAGEADPASAGLAWLRTRQSAAGWWASGDGLPGGSWTTSLAVLALSHFAEAREGAARGAAWLLDQEGAGSPWWVRLIFRLFPERRSVELDPDLTGWSWTEGTFSWIEPTAYALMALGRMRASLPARRVAERIELGERMILDRECAGGGWNYGNSRVLGEELWPYPDTTALALIALRNRPDSPEVERGLAALDRMLGENRSILSLGLAGLAFRAHGRRIAALGEEVGTGLLTAPGQLETRAVAWAALALADGADPLAAGASREPAVAAGIPTDA